MIVADTQPIQNLKILNKIEKDFGEKYKAPWAKHWIEVSFDGNLKKFLKF